jgi:HEAT repeat protein
MALGCSNFIGTTATSFMRHIRDDPDPNHRYAAYGKLADLRCYDRVEQKTEAVKLLAERLESGKEPLASRAVILNTLGVLGDPAARDVVVKHTSNPEPVMRVQACRALGRVGATEDATILTRIMAMDTLEDCRIAAIEALGELKPKDPRITRMLIEGMRHDDPATRLASLRSLRKITGKDYGLDSVAWMKALPGDADDQAQTASLASKASAAPSLPAAAAAAAPVYPLQPPQLQSIVDSRLEMAGKLTPNEIAKDTTEQGASFVQQPPKGGPPPGVGIGTYPGRNPNLPTPR